MAHYVFAVQCVAVVVTMLSIPIAGLCVTQLRTNRADTATACAVVFSVALNVLFTAPGLHLLWRRRWRRRCPGAAAAVLPALRSASLTFLRTSFLIHLSWELIWVGVLVPLRKTLLQSVSPQRRSLLLYPWFVYIDAGDRRYLDAPADLVAMEILSVVNGAIGLACLANLHVSQRRDARGDGADANSGGDAGGGGNDGRGAASAGAAGGVHRRSLVWLLGLGVCAAVHLYSCALYFIVEMINGLPNCDRSSYVNIVFAFGLANLPWLYMPLVVFWWIKDEVSVMLAVNGGPAASSQLKSE